MAKQTRTKQKRDIEANWKKATGFTPYLGEIIVYEPDAAHISPRFKVGDGSTNINNLPFVNAANLADIGVDSFAVGQGVRLSGQTYEVEILGITITIGPIDISTLSVLSDVGIDATSLVIKSTSSTTKELFEKLEGAEYNGIIVQIGNQILPVKEYSSFEVNTYVPLSYKATLYLMDGFTVTEAITAGTAITEVYMGGAVGDYSFASNNKTLALGKDSHAEGSLTTTTAAGVSAHAEGYLTIAGGVAAHAEGNNTTASGNGSHAEGANTVASTTGAHAEGYKAQATGDNAHAEGNNTLADSASAHAEGYNSQAKNTAAHAEGNGTKALGSAAHSEGIKTNALGNYSHAEGNGTTTGILNDDGSITGGASAHAEGAGTTASGNYSHAEGSGTTASGLASHSTGAGTTASGAASFAAGNGTIASASHASTFGNQTRAGQGNQFVIGRYNDNKTSTLFEVGNGSKEDEKDESGNITTKNRSNAFEVYNDGHAELLKQGTADNSVVIKSGLKTINGNSIVGDGDIEIDSGVTPNWNQWDPEQPDYIEGKTHGMYTIPEMTWNGETEGQTSVTLNEKDYVLYTESETIFWPTEITLYNRETGTTTTHKSTKTETLTYYNDDAGTISYGEAWYYEGYDYPIIYTISDTAYDRFPKTGNYLLNDDIYVSKMNSEFIIPLDKKFIPELSYNDLVNIPELADVATSGSYNDLSDTPNIPTVDQTYNAISENAQSGKAVASAISSKQDTLVSGTNIKAINNESILGNGNIEIKLPEITVDEEYNADSDNAQSGKAVADAFDALNIKNGTGTGSLNQKQNSAYEVINIATKNTNAASLDTTLTDTETIGAIGNYSTVFGGSSSAQGISSFAEGYGNIAKGNQSHAEGNSSVALGVNAHAEGSITTAFGNQSHAEGYKSQALAAQSHAEGQTTTAFGASSHAEGYNAQSIGVAAHAEGNGTKAYGDNSHTEGYKTITGLYQDGAVVSGKWAHAEGTSTKAYGDAAHSEGASSEAHAYASHAEGQGKAYAMVSHAEGNSTAGVNGDDTTATYAHAEGKGTFATGNAAHSEGSGTIASGKYSHAEGAYTESSAYATHTSGYYTVAGYENQFVAGQYNDNKADTLFEIGNGVSATYDDEGNLLTEEQRYNAFEVYTDGHAEVALQGTTDKSVITKGYNGNIKNSTGNSSIQQVQDSGYTGIAIVTKNPQAAKLDSTLTDNETIGAIGEFASSFGGASSAQGKRSLAEGTNTIAKGKYSHAEGDNSVTLGNESHAEGYATTAYGQGSHAEGHNTQAIGAASHSEGIGTIAEGSASHASGTGSQALKDYSAAFGNQTRAAANNQFVVGKFNEVINEPEDEEDSALFIVGNGDDEDNRRNAFEVYKDGTIKAQYINISNFSNYFTINSNDINFGSANGINIDASGGMNISGGQAFYNNSEIATMDNLIGYGTELPTTIDDTLPKFFVLI